jgi:hypothetical protein
VRCPAQSSARQVVIGSSPAPRSIPTRSTQISATRLIRLPSTMLYPTASDDTRAHSRSMDKLHPAFKASPGLGGDTPTVTQGHHCRHLRRQPGALRHPSPSRRGSRAASPSSSAPHPPPVRLPACASTIASGTTPFVRCVACPLFCLFTPDGDPPATLGIYRRKDSESAESLIPIS